VLPEAQRNVTLAKSTWEEIAAAMDVLEIALARGEWLVGSAFSVADLNVASAMVRVMITPALDSAVANWPKVHARLHKCWSRPAANRALAMRGRCNGAAIGADAPGWKSFPAQECPQLCAAQSRRRLSKGAALVLRSTRDLAELRRDITQWLAKWQGKYPRLCNWVEDNIEGTHDLLPAAAPQTHEIDQHARTAKPGTKAPHPRRADLPQCRELLAVGAGIGGRDARELARSARYLNIDHLKEHKKEALRALAA
jgi:Glutathione S-transferase, C-terminal domain